MFVGTGSSNSSDEELIAQFRSSNDMAALAELFTRYSALVYGVCLKYLKDSDNAKDAVMQVFEKLNKSLKAHQIEHFKSWLYITSKNHCLMQLRAQKKIIMEEIREDFMENQLFLHQETEDLRGEDLLKLEKCIEQLKNGQKDCVQLFYIKEMCYKEIVNSTGIELNKVKSYIQNGKRNLKICMEQSE